MGGVKKGEGQPQLIVFSDSDTSTTHDVNQNNKTFQQPSVNKKPPGPLPQKPPKPPRNVSYHFSLVNLLFLYFS